jgi:hypothetical protein
MRPSEVSRVDILSQNGLDEIFLDTSFKAVWRSFKALFLAF